MTHVWIETTKFYLLDRNPNRVVAKQPTPNKGYLLVFGKKASYAPTVEKAKDYVESFAELGRWP